MTATAGHGRFGARFKGRKRAVDLLFEAEARGREVEAVARERAELAAGDPEVAGVSDFAHAIVAGVGEHTARIDAVIAENLTEWTLPRLPAVDRAILRVAVWELFYSDVPPLVAVDQAVELAGRLSTDDSAGFVNGVLDSIAAVAPQVRSAAAATLAAVSVDPAQDRDDLSADDEELHTVPVVHEVEADQVPADAVPGCDSAPETPEQPRP